MTAYAVNETNGLDVIGSDYHSTVTYEYPMSLGEVADAGGKITRLRVLSDCGRGDVSYVHATLPDGRVVPLHQDYPMGFYMRELKGELIKWAKSYGVFAKGLGLLDENNWSVLR